MIHRQPAVIEDIYADPRVPIDAYRPTFVRSLVMVPIRSDNPIGAIGNYWACRRMPTEEEVSLLQALADSTSVALQNVELYSELQVQIRERTAALQAAQRELEERRRAESELLRVESQLRQVQKMEAIGRLAGGIAHDFNNVLSVVLTCSEMALLDLEPDSPVRADIEEIHQAGERAGRLTRQLLAFSRQQVIEPRALVINEAVQSMQTMLRRVLGNDIELEARLADELFAVLADSGQIEQVLMNLIINARDAMPKGGRITLATANVRLNGQYALSHLGVTEGDYVLLSVTDTGTGMAKETQQRIFEPFFTTKEKGKGTGLGLSTVYGIVKQMGGHIWLHSEPGQGTVFELYLPRLLEEVKPTCMDPVDVRTLTGTETILVVEDEDDVRDAVLGILRRNGYNVLFAKGPTEAILVSDKYCNPIDLMITDVVMPTMSGTQLAGRLVQDRPTTKVLCMSGYTDDAIVEHGVIESQFAFLQKPITPERLLRKVRMVLTGLQPAT
jgi:signal transduction histidine kinase/CheY-like chemotaxis protein